MPRARAPSPRPSRDEIEDALRRVAGVSVAVLGDFAVDAYWDLAPEAREHSVETGRPVRQVVGQRYGLGGAGNVAANLAALGARVVPVARWGADPFGAVLRAQLRALGLDLDFVRNGPPGWQTVAYIKPHHDGVEQDRIDLGAGNALDDEARAVLLADLAAALDDCGGVVINQQRRPGLADPVTLAALSELAAQRPDRVLVVDARDHAGQCRKSVLKINGHEALALLGEPRDPRQPVAIDEALDAAARLASAGWEPLFVTLGAAGLLVATATEVHPIPAVPAQGLVDSVGAGDTLAAALAACLVAGCGPLLAGHVANLAAGVTVRKLRMTGTATPAEVLALAGELS